MTAPVADIGAKASSTKAQCSDYSFGKASKIACCLDEPHDELARKAP